MNNEKTGLIKSFIYSFTSFDKYRMLLRESTGKAVGYLILLTLLLSIVLYVPLGIQLSGIFDTVSVYITENLPDFTFSGGQLSVDAEMPIVIEGSGTAVVIDTTPGAEDRILNQYDSVMLITSDNIIQKNYVNRQDIPLSIYQGFNMTKDTLIASVPMLKPILIIGFIFAGIFFVIGKFISALVVSLIGKIANSSAKTNLSYRNIFKISIYAMTLPMIIGTVLNVLNIAVPLLWVLFYIGSGVYVFGAINSIKREIAAAGSNGYGFNNYGGDSFNSNNFNSSNFSNNNFNNNNFGNNNTDNSNGNSYPSAGDPESNSGNPESNSGNPESNSGNPEGSSGDNEDTDNTDIAGSGNEQNDDENKGNDGN